MTSCYAVIGNPIAQTKSPLIYQEFARRTAQDMRYEAILAPLDGFAEALAEFRARGGKGVNVAMPFKLEAFGLATDLTERARLAGAVNVLGLDGERIFADNTDGVGLVRDIRLNLGLSIRGARVLLLGAGGAAHGVVLPILEEQPALLAIANRTVAKAQALGAQFSRHGNVAAGGYADVAGEPFDLVINATPAKPCGEPPAVPGAAFRGCGLAYDVVYGQGLTPFLRFARESGAGRVADGTGMLLEQAAENFFIWRGIRPETRAMIRKLSTLPV
jgi:shikimate dehydrogenase